MFDNLKTSRTHYKKQFATIRMSNSILPSSLQCPKTKHEPFRMPGKSQLDTNPNELVNC